MTNWVQTISANCMINLHAALLFTCLFLWVIICAVITVFIVMGISCICCMCMFSVISMWIHVFTYIFGCLRFIYNVSTRVLCVYILIACSVKNLYGIAQLDAGYVTVCSAERKKVFSRVACLDMGGQGCYIRGLF